MMIDDVTVMIKCMTGMIIEFTRVFVVVLIRGINLIPGGRRTPFPPLSTAHDGKV